MSELKLTGHGAGKCIGAVAGQGRGGGHHPELKDRRLRSPHIILRLKKCRLSLKLVAQPATCVQKGSTYGTGGLLVRRASRLT